MSTKIKDIFDHISELENHEFEINKQYLNKTKFQIETLDGYVDVVSMMVKEDTGVNIKCEDLEVLVSSSHRIETPSGTRYVKELIVGDMLSNKNGDVAITEIIKINSMLVYDLTIDKDDHLFLDSNGFIHHNTWHITEGPRSLLKLLGGEGKKWTYHAGVKAAPFSFYKTLFQERDKVIVFDEADAILKHDDIIMMLKPILDTSGSNFAEYMSGTMNMVGKSHEEIESYSKWVDSQLEIGTPLGMGKDDLKLPSKFQFNGGMIFVSNMGANQIEKAIMSRSIFVDVHLAAQDMLKRIKSIGYARSKSDGLSKSDVNDIMEALGAAASGPEVEITYMTAEYARKGKAITLRAYQLAVVLKKSGLTRWAALASLYS